MENQLTRLEYETIKKYQSEGYKYMSVNRLGDVVFSNYPLNEIKKASVYFEDASVFKDFHVGKDYDLNGIMENIVRVK